MFQLVDVVFAVLAVITVVSAILALEAKEVVYGAIALALSFVGIAGFFALLDAVFLAMFQLTVYVGA
ncbi:MAG: NADH-quinone oxidoreductase subunit J, partial [Nitrososphaerales archaeon]